MKARINIAATMLVAAMSAASAAAQDRQTTPESILGSYVAGDVRITRVGGARFNGALAAVHEGQVEILTSNGTRTIPLDSIVRIERRGDSLKNGFIAGAVVGGLMGFLACFECEGAGIRIFSAAMTGTIYGVAGIGIDALHDGWRPLYVRKEKGPQVRRATPAALVSLRLRF